MKAPKSPFKSESNRIKHVNDYYIVQLEHYTLSEPFYTEYGYKLTNQCYVVESIPKDKSDTIKKERVDIIGDYVAKKIFKLTINNLFHYLRYIPMNINLMVHKVLL